MGKQCAACGQNSVPWLRVLAASSGLSCSRCGERNQVGFSPARVVLQGAAFFAYFFAFAMTRATSLAWVWLPLLVFLGAFTWAVTLSGPLRLEVRRTSGIKIQQAIRGAVIFLAIVLASGIGMILGREWHATHPEVFTGSSTEVEGIRL